MSNTDEARTKVREEFLKSCRLINPLATVRTIHYALSDFENVWTNPGRKFFTPEYYLYLIEGLKELCDAGEVTVREYHLLVISTCYYRLRDSFTKVWQDLDAESSYYALMTARELGFSRDDITFIEDATRRFEYPHQNSKMVVINDVILKFFSESPEVFDEYIELRKHDCALCADFGLEMRTFLETLQQNETFYMTDYAKEHWETQAQENVSRLLESI